MQFSEKGFISCVNAINKKNYDYGNDILYRNCVFGKLPDPPSSEIGTELSSMIWLIGKAYSADPTRSAVSGTFANKGLGSTFEVIAKGIYTHPSYDGFYQSLRKLLQQEYSYQCEKDRSILLETAKLVAILNEMITATMEHAAEAKDLEKQKTKNVISFCSKFLHFMCPNLFFIIDSYSFNGGMALFSGSADRMLYVAEDGSSENIPIDKDARNYFRACHSLHCPSDNDVPGTVKDYYKHCLRAYRLACFLKDKDVECPPQIAGDSNSRYMPRLVDSILMRIS